MCNRYRMSAKQAEMAAALGVTLPHEADETYPPPELFPDYPACVVRADGGGRRIDVMRWGVPPPAQARAKVTNVRNLASPFWRGALAAPARRCLVPVTAFCEWTGEKGRKTACWFAVPSRPVFAFAGLWRETAEGPRFAFLTTDPNPLVAPVHPKAMPVILHAEDHARWLDAPYADACALAVPYPSQLMTMTREDAPAADASPAQPLLL